MFGISNLVQYWWGQVILPSTLFNCLKIAMEGQDALLGFGLSWASGYQYTPCFVWGCGLKAPPFRGHANPAYLKQRPAPRNGQGQVFKHPPKPVRYVMSQVWIVHHEHGYLMPLTSDRPVAVTQINGFVMVLCLLSMQKYCWEPCLTLMSLARAVTGHRRPVQPK